MTDNPTTKVTVYLPWHNETSASQARAQYIASLRRQGRIEPELEDAIINDKPITAARRQAVEEERLARSGFRRSPPPGRSGSEIAVHELDRLAWPQGRGIADEAWRVADRVLCRRPRA